MDIFEFNLQFPTTYNDRQGNLYNFNPTHDGPVGTYIKSFSSGFEIGGEYRIRLLPSEAYLTLGKTEYTLETIENGYNLLINGEMKDSLIRVAWA